MRMYYQPSWSVTPRHIQKASLPLFAFDNALHLSNHLLTFLNLKYHQLQISSALAKSDLCAKLHWQQGVVSCRNASNTV